MFLTVHGTAAIIIVKHVSNPAAAISLAFLSHYLLDAIPHGDDALMQRVPKSQQLKVITLLFVIDMLVSLGWFWYLHSQGIFNGITPLLVIAASMLPDFLMGIYMLLPLRFLKWNMTLMEQAHRWFHKTPLPMATGFLIQLVFFFVATWYLFQL